MEQELGANRDINELYLFGSVGVLILLIACTNYMNMATARSANRAREVGLRKVVGADRGQLIRQFMGEAVLVTILAFAGAVILTEMFLPILNAAVGKSLGITYGGRFFCILAAAALAVGALAGSYPCAVERRGTSVGASPTRQGLLQPACAGCSAGRSVATGSVMKATTSPKPPV